MKVAISLLSGVGYGGKTYFTHLIPALASLESGNEYHLFVPRGYPIASSPNMVFHECIGGNTSSIKRFLWEQFLLPFELKKKKIDIMFTAKSMNIFFAPCKTIVASRNLEPFFYKEYDNNWHLNLLSWLKYHLHRWSLKKADAIVAVSRAVKDRLIERFPEAGKKIFMVYNGNPVQDVILERSRATRGEAIGSSYQSGFYQSLRSFQNDRPFILTASKFVAYANQLNLLKAYRLLRERRGDVPKLWFAGGIHDKKYFEKCERFVRENGLQDTVKFLGLVPQEELFELYRKARLFVFPSTLESCPHTLIEVMACATPIATTNIEPMPEICADAAVYFQADDPEDIARQVQRLFDDAELCEVLRSHGLRRSKDFTWEKTARGMVEVFNTCHPELVSEPALN